MKRDMESSWRENALAVVLALLYFCGCESVETGGVAVTEDSAQGVLCCIEAPKGCPGVLEEKYLVLDISSGPDAANWPAMHLDKTPVEGWGDEYKTDKIVLRKVNAGSYWRQRCTPEEAWNHKAINAPSEMFVKKSFYIGVFEITQRQYELVTGKKPSYHSPSEGWEKLPVENVSYDDIRGSRKGACYPNSSDVDAQSFIGILRQKTGIMNIDLPSEDVWEYCCTAGGSFIDLKQLEATARVSHYTKTSNSTSSSPVAVGSYKPNALGLFDMQGNVCEWCLDFTGGGETKPIPPLRLGCNRMIKGGHYETLPELCHPSIAYHHCSGFVNCGVGFRISCY